MKKDEQREDIPSARDREAAEWLAKRLRGFAPQEQDEFFAWLAEVPRNGEWFASHSRSWKRLDALVQWRPEHSDAPSQDLLQVRPRRARWLPLLGGLAAAFALGIIGARWHFDSPTPAAAPSVASIIASETEKHFLEDGSRVDLNQGAAVKINYSPTKRRVELVAKEAHFNVTKDPRRPFVVVANGVEIVAIGTAFNVRIENGNVEVLVTEGVVRVGASEIRAATTADPELAPDEPASRELRAGQMSVIYAQGQQIVAQVRQSTVDELSRMLEWRRSLDFDTVPLGEVVAELNRRNTLQLEIRDQNLENLPIVASLRTNDPNQFVELLKLAMGIEARIEQGRIQLTGPEAE